MDCQRTDGFILRQPRIRDQKGRSADQGNLSPLPYAIEDAFIASGNGVEKYRPYLLDAVSILERGGADFLVLPCNSLHAYIEDIRASASVPVLSILEACAVALKKDAVARVVVLATPFTASRHLSFVRGLR